MFIYNLNIFFHERHIIYLTNNSTNKHRVSSYMLCLFVVCCCACWICCSPLTFLFVTFLIYLFFRRDDEFLFQSNRHSHCRSHHHPLLLQSSKL
mmetsp:Transcript_3862/g.5236  ORF Transcript_3862/g.5236 Transcript_3862/m.5236 type:complete len:94 (-) Transcript_3862:1198-1479(-)